MGEKKEDDIKLHIQKASRTSPEFGDELRGFVEAVRNQFVQAVEASATATGIASIPEYPNFHHEMTRRLDEIQGEARGIRGDTKSLRGLAERTQAKEAQERTLQSRLKKGIFWLIKYVIAWLLGYSMGRFLPL